MRSFILSEPKLLLFGFFISLYYDYPREMMRGYLNFLILFLVKDCIFFIIIILPPAVRNVEELIYFLTALKCPGRCSPISRTPINFFQISMAPAVSSGPIASMTCLLSGPSIAASSC